MAHNTAENRDAPETATVTAKVDPAVKEQAEHILAAWDLTPSQAVELFYRHVIRRKGLPFGRAEDVPLPLNLNLMTREELHAALDEALANAQAGNLIPAEQVYAELEREFGL